MVFDKSSAFIEPFHMTGSLSIYHEAAFMRGFVNRM